MTTHRIVALAYVLFCASGCRAVHADGDSCLSFDSYCDGDTLVECAPNRNNLGIVRRTACDGTCLPRTGENAACVYAAQPCDPATHVPSCADGAYDTRLVIACEPVFGGAPTHYPVAVEPGCRGAEIYTCNADDTATHVRCEHDNACQAPDGRPLVCAFASSPCDPATFEQGCSANDNVVVCAEVFGAGQHLPLAVPPGSPQAAITCP